MIDLLNKLSEKYFLQLGDYKFSPVLKLTTGISLEYCEMLKESKCTPEPLIFCFPEKKAAALWTSISMLTNYYLEDYVNVGDEGISLKEGDKIFIYGCVAQIERIQNGTIFLKFKDQGGFQLNERLKSQLSLASAKRSLNLLKNYKKARKEAKNNRNPISKILYPNDEVFINQRNLKSKILLVAGRGQTRKFHDFLETVEIYDEKLQRVFPEGENLIITQDLKRYESFANPKNEIDEDDFIESLKKASRVEKFVEIHESLKHLISLYYTDSRITEEFDHQFEDLINEFNDEIPQLEILKNKYPGLSEHLREDIRAVIINEVSQLSDYSQTVKSFLEAGIPVIVFCDRKVIGVEDLSSFQTLFSERPNAYRLNWNKKKLKALISASEVEECGKIIRIKHEEESRYGIDSDFGTKSPREEDLFIDKVLWDQALRYIDQNIHIDIYKGDPLDILAPEILHHIKSLDEFEILQKSFYQNLYPAIYALKNSKCTHDDVLKLIGWFEDDLKAVKNQLPKEIAQDFINAIDVSMAFYDNSKRIEYTEDTFSIGFPLAFKKNFSIPIGAEILKIPFSNKKRIIFTGYPFNEYSGKYLINSVCVDFVPEIVIKCWPNEASLTYNYLKRRIEGGYFFDRLPKGIEIEKSLKIKSDSDIQNEIDSYLLLNGLVTNEIQIEKDLELVHQFKYKGYQLNGDDRVNWKVNSDVLNFDDGSFMFLAKGSKILCLSEDFKGGARVLKKTADQFFSGDIIFRYVKDRGAYVEISKKDSNISESYSELDYWKNVLNELFVKNNFSIELLEASLRKTKEYLNLEGNPTCQNLNRWLFDDEVISPDEDNLRLILTAAEIDEVETHLSVLMLAYKKATAHRIRLSSKIKKEIYNKISKLNHLNCDFQISLNGEFIDVEARTISTIDTNGTIVDYYHTRKILC